MEDDNQEEFELGKRYPRLGKYFACKNCGERQFGRSNKEYCDGVCRNEFNNARRKERGSVHPTLKKIEEQDLALRQIHDRFGSEWVDMDVMDMASVSVDGPSHELDSPEGVFEAYLDFAIQMDFEKIRFRVMAVAELLKMEKEDAEPRGKGLLDL